MKAFQAKKWIAAAALASIGIFGTAGATAGIIKIKDAQSCSVEGLDEADAVRGGVHCDTGGDSFSLTGVLDGTIGLWVGDSKTPSWNLINDTGSFLSSLTLYYSGLLANNADIDMQVGDGIFSVCYSIDANGVTAGKDGSCSAKSAKPEDGLVLPLQMTWSMKDGDSGLAEGASFNLGTASFAHSGQDAGCFSGTATCGPLADVPAPGILGLMVLGFAGLVGVRRRAAAA